jgi:hypothetical protein
MILYISSYIIIATALYFVWKILTAPEIERKHIIRNSIYAIIQANEHFSDKDKVQLIATWLDNVNFHNVPEWQKNGLKNKILDKIAG